MQETGAQGVKLEGGTKWRPHPGDGGDRYSGDGAHRAHPQSVHAWAATGAGRRRAPPTGCWPMPRRSKMRGPAPWCSSWSPRGCPPGSASAHHPDHRHRRRPRLRRPGAGHARHAGIESRFQSEVPHAMSSLPRKSPTPPPLRRGRGETGKYPAREHSFELTACFCIPHQIHERPRGHVRFRGFREDMFSAPANFTR
jgi:hypothetical protein